MVEETNVLLDKRYAQFLGRLEDGAVILAAAGRGNIPDAGAGRPEDVVGKWKLHSSSATTGKARFHQGRAEQGYGGPTKASLETHTSFSCFIQL